MKTLVINAYSKAPKPSEEVFNTMCSDEHKIKRIKIPHPSKRANSFKPSISPILFTLSLLNNPGCDNEWNQTETIKIKG